MKKVKQFNEDRPRGRPRISLDRMSAGKAIRLSSETMAAIDTWRLRTAKGENPILTLSGAVRELLRIALMAELGLDVDVGDSGYRRHRDVRKSVRAGNPQA